MPTRFVASASFGADPIGTRSKVYQASSSASFARDLSLPFGWAYKYRIIYRSVYGLARAAARWVNHSMPGGNQVATRSRAR